MTCKHTGRSSPVTGKKRGIVVASLLVLVVGCGAKKPTVTVERTRPTGLFADEIAALVLLEYEDCHVGRAGNASCDAPEDPTSEESKFLTCLSRDASRVRFGSSNRVRESISVSSTTNIMEELSDESVRQRLLESNLRYVILLTASTDTSYVGTRFDAEYFLWMIGPKKMKSSILDAVVWDVAESQEVGRLRSASSGDKGFVLPVLLVIPLPPVAWTSFTERKACRGLGVALEQFLLMEDGR